MVVMLNEKFRESVTGVWDLFQEDQGSRFESFFHHVCCLLIDEPFLGRSTKLNNSSSIPPPTPCSLQVKRFLLIFLIYSFQSLETRLVRVECLRLVGLGIWSQLASDERRNLEYQKAPTLRKLIGKLEKKFKNSGKKEKNGNSLPLPCFSSSAGLLRLCL